MNSLRLTNVSGASYVKSFNLTQTSLEKSDTLFLDAKSIYSKKFGLNIKPHKNLMSLILELIKSTFLGAE